MESGRKASSPASSRQKANRLASPPASSGSMNSVHTRPAMPSQAPVVSSSPTLDPPGISRHSRANGRAASTPKT